MVAKSIPIARRCSSLVYYYALVALALARRNDGIVFPTFAADAAVHALVVDPPRVSERGLRAIARHATALRSVMRERERWRSDTVTVAAEHAPLHGVFNPQGNETELRVECDMGCVWMRRVGSDTGANGANATAFSLDKPYKPGKLELVRRSAQRVIVTTMENRAGHAETRTLAQQGRLGERVFAPRDILVSHELDATVPIVNYMGSLLSQLRDLAQQQPLPGAEAGAQPTERPGARAPLGVSGLPLEDPQRKRRDAAVAAFISNCNPAGSVPGAGRLDVLRALGSHGVPVHQYGRCEHTQGLAAADRRAHRRSTVRWSGKALRAADYRFFAALENSQTLDYVTEKVFDALTLGAVPLYLGAPNVHDLLPCEPPERCVIEVSRFVDGNGGFDAPQLAAHLQHLAANDTAYLEYHSWRAKPLPQRVLDLVEIHRHKVGCRVCHCIAGRLPGCDGQTTTPVGKVVGVITSWTR